MTDQYYDREDDLPETEETALANFEAAANQVATFVPEAAEDLNRSEEMFRHLWDQAARHGDTGSQAMIEQLWKIAERYATRISQLDANGQLAKTAIEKIQERRKQVQEEYDQLNDAIAEAESQGYTTHPRLVDLIEAIEESEGEEFETGLYIEDPGMEAHANGWWDCLIPEAVDILTYALFGDIGKTVPTELREKLAEFVNGFGDEMLEVKRSRRAAFMEALDRYDSDEPLELLDEEDLDDEFFAEEYDE